MSTIQAPNNYCTFRLIVPPDQQFSFELISNLSTYPGTVVSYLPGTDELKTVGNFLIAALNNQNPKPIKLSEESGQRTLSMSASGSTITITMYEANISTTLSVAFSVQFHFFLLATAANQAISWSGGEAPKLM